MKLLKLLPEDFNLLIPMDEPDTKRVRLFYEQYVDPTDCPIYRALKREGHNVLFVSPDYAVIDKLEYKLIIEFEATPEDLRIASDLILKGQGYELFIEEQHEVLN